MLADALITGHVMQYKDLPHYVTTVTPGETYAADVQLVREEIAALDPESDGYDADLAALRAELKRLRSLPSKPPKVERKPDTNPDGTVRTIDQHWQSMDTAGRRAWLMGRGYKYTVWRGDDGMIGGSITSDDPIGDVETLAGLPLGFYPRVLTEARNIPDPRVEN